MAKQLSLEDLVKLIISKDELSEYAFAGNCFNMAVALKSLAPEAEIVVSCNKAIHEHSRNFIGHCAIKFKDHYIDGDGTLSEDDFLSWGMLDEQDFSYIEKIPEISKKRWKTLAHESVFIPVTESDLESYLDQKTIKKIKEILNSKPR